MTPISRRAAALGLAALVTGFWLWFGVASAFAERLGARNWLLHMLMPGGILLATVAIAWKWQAAGGALLLVEGLAVAVGYPLFAAARSLPISWIVLTLLTMSLPPILSGALLLTDARQRGN